MIVTVKPVNSARPESFGEPCASLEEVCTSVKSSAASTTEKTMRPLWLSPPSDPATRLPSIIRSARESHSALDVGSLASASPSAGSLLIRDSLNVLSGGLISCCCGYEYSCGRRVILFPCFVMSHGLVVCVESPLSSSMVDLFAPLEM